MFLSCSFKWLVQIVAYHNVLRLTYIQLYYEVMPDCFRYSYRNEKIKWKKVKQSINQSESESIFYFLILPFSQLFIKFCFDKNEPIIRLRSVYSHIVQWMNYSSSRNHKKSNLFSNDLLFNMNWQSIRKDSVRKHICHACQFAAVDHIFVWKMWIRNFPPVESS